MSLVVDDAYIEKVKSFIVAQCESIDSIISRYIQTMNDVIETGFIEGETAKALRAFLAAVKSDVTNNDKTPVAVVSEIERYCADFITKVNEADKQLY